MAAAGLAGICPRRASQAYQLDTAASLRAALAGDSPAVSSCRAYRVTCSMVAPVTGCTPCSWCQEQGVHPVTGATMLHVTRYARQLDTAGLSPASAARKLAAVSSWYAWLARRGHIPASPAAAITRPRTGPAAPPAPGLTQAQALRLLHAADQAPGH